MSDAWSGESGAAVSPAKGRWWLWLPLGCFGTALIVFMIGAAVISGRAAVRWKEFSSKNALLKARITRVAGEREPIEGPAIEGNAWKEYLAASDRLATMTDEERMAIDEFHLGKGGPQTSARAFAALDAHAADLEAIRKAAHLNRYQDGLKWEDGWSATMNWLNPFRLSGRVLQASAQRRRMAGDFDGCLDDIAALAQLGCDTASSGPLICHLCGLGNLRFALAQGATLGVEPALTAAQAVRLGRILQGAESSLRPFADVLEADHLLINEAFTALAEGRGNSDELGFPAAARIVAWRHGFSWRILAADVDVESSHISDVARDLAGKPWSVAAPRYDALEDAWNDDKFLSLIFASPGRMDRGDRAAHARLRLVRALAAERAGTPLAPLPDDPFTAKPLHVRVSGDRTTWWSEWIDGDDGGKGKFEDEPSDHSDIPLEWTKGK